MGFRITANKGPAKSDNVEVSSGSEAPSEVRVEGRAATVPMAGSGASVYSLAERRPAVTDRAVSPLARLFGDVTHLDPVGRAKALAVGHAFVEMIFPRNGQSGPQARENA